MKNHPVDDLFTKKLSDWEKQPSYVAWTRVAKEQKTRERKVAMWGWYAAASIVIATMAGYLVWQENGKESQYLSMENGATKINKKADVDLSVSLDSTKEKNKVKPIGEIVETTPGHIERYADNSKERTENKSVSKNNKSDLYIEPEMKSIEESEIAEAKIEKEDLPAKIVQSAVVAESTKDSAMQISLASREPEVKERNRTIMVNVKVPENELNEKSRTSRFTKVFRQLKNARAGDPVDWQEVGFSPKNIVAKLDEKVRNKEEEISEKYQNIKHRTKL